MCASLARYMSIPALMAFVAFCNPLAVQAAYAQDAPTPAQDAPPAILQPGMCLTKDNNTFVLSRQQVYRDGKFKIKFNGWENVTATYHQDIDKYLVTGGTLNLESNMSFVKSSILDPTWIVKNHQEYVGLDFKGQSDLCPGVEIELNCGSNALPAEHHPLAADFSLSCTISQF